MKFPRRQFLQLAAAAAVLPAVSKNATAQTYPARPVRLIVGYTPGGSADLTARLIGQWLSERLGQPFVIENRAGAGGTIGARAVGKVVNDDRADWREAWALFPGSVAYIWHAGTKAGIVQDSLAACGFETRSQIIWAKNNFAIGRGHYHCKHEPCWYVVRKGSTASWVGDHSQTTLWQIDKNLKSETGHGTQKPVECMRRPIENNASPGQAVYEPFSGSGTTIIAAEMTGRVCHAIEIAPAYVDVAVKRWQEFTGQQAVLDGDGRSFDSVAAQRAR